MAANIRAGPEFPVRNFECVSRFGMMGKGGHFTQSRSVGAPGSMHFVRVKFLKILETRRCLSVPSIAYGMASNLVEVPICFRNVTSKILQP